MKKLIICGIGIFLSKAPLSAQSDSTLVDLPADTAAAQGYKNEIGFNAGPLLLIFLGSTPDWQPAGISYKRVINRWAFRTNISVTTFQPNRYYYRNEKVYITDTLHTVMTEYNKNTIYAGRVGMEYRLPLRRNCYLVLGADLQGRVKNDSRIIDQSLLRVDSIKERYSAEPRYYTTRTFTQRALDERTISKQVGIGFSLGLLVPLGDRWWLSTQCRADSFFGPSEYTVKDYIAATKKSSTSQNFDLDVGSPLTDISLFFRF
jgi:hypothetical protein